MIGFLRRLFRKRWVIGNCKVCNHEQKCHGQFRYFDPLIGESGEYVTELSCIGDGYTIPGFYKENKCKCWRFEELDNLGLLEKLSD